jgi:hypothetical protein
LISDFDALGGNVPIPAPAPPAPPAPTPPAPTPAGGPVLTVDQACALLRSAWPKHVPNTRPARVAPPAAVHRVVGASKVARAFNRSRGR